MDGIGALPPPPPALEPAPGPARKRSRVAWFVGIAAVALLALVLVLLLWPRDRLPAEFGGQPILRGGMLDALEEGMESFEMAGFKVDIAFYGRSPLQPDYMVLVTNGPAPLDASPGGSLFEQLPAGLMSRDNAEIDFSRAVRRTRDGVEFACVPGERTDVDVVVTMCIFEGDFAGIVIATNGTGLAALLDITMQLQGDLA